MAITATPAPARALAADHIARRLFHRPLYPHQVEAIRATTQRNPDGTYLYPRVVWLWPRQTGKTTAELCLALGRAAAVRDFRAVYMAQTGHITTLRFTDWQQRTAHYPALFRNRKSQGTERITVPARESWLAAFPPIPGRLRSASLDLVMVDEAQEHADELGRKLDADIVPTFDTRPAGQWIISGTAGGIDAEYFRRHYRLALDQAPGYLLVELGTPPPDADASDPDVVADYHPGVAAGLTTRARIHDARSALGSQRFAREYGNRWDSASIASVFPPDSWRACHRPNVQMLDPVALALEVFPERDRAVLVAAGPSSLDPDARVVDLVAEAELSRIVALAKANSDAARCPIIVDPQAPTVTHIERLRRARVRVHEASFRDVVTASLGLYDRVTQQTIHHTSQPPMDAAALAAQSRAAGTRWAFERTAPGGSYMMAAALAVHHVDHTADAPDRHITAG